MAHTLISAGQVVSGTIRAGEDLVIAGRVRGSVESEGLVVVEAGGVIEADLRAREIVVRGVVVGEVAAVEQLEVAANGQVLGTVKTRRLLLRPGGRIHGDVTTGMEIQAAVYSDRLSGAQGTRPQAATRGLSTGASASGASLSGQSPFGAASKPFPSASASGGSAFGSYRPASSTPLPRSAGAKGPSFGGGSAGFTSSFPAGSVEAPTPARPAPPRRLEDFPPRVADALPTTTPPRASRSLTPPPSPPSVSEWLMDAAFDEVPIVDDRKDAPSPGPNDTNPAFDVVEIDETEHEGDARAEDTETRREES